MIALSLSILCVQAQADADAGKVEVAKKTEGLDISQVFPDEKIEHKMEMKGMKVYNYMLSDKFTALQEKLGQFLGEAWVLEDAEVQAQAIAEAQKAGGIAAFIDAEHAFDQFYARSLGVDVENLLISLKHAFIINKYNKKG